nr:unnamed protein product [Digitaria exilis]
MVAVADGPHVCAVWSLALAGTSALAFMWAPSLPPRSSSMGRKKKSRMRSSYPHGPPLRLRSPTRTGVGGGHGSGLELQWELPMRLRVDLGCPALPSVGLHGKEPPPL